MSDLDPRAADILNFWFTETEPKMWFVSDAEFDGDIQNRFGGTHEMAAAGDLDQWMGTAPGALALIILLDQFSRNIHRGSAAAFASDPKAVALADQAVASGHDLATDKNARAFFYLPYMHSEDLSIQDKCIELIRERLGEESGNLPHAIWHRDVIKQFQRFPFRNKALGRESTAAEKAFLERDNVPG